MRPSTFVKTRLLPQDRVALIAYGRATDLTTDRTSILRLLERYRERHAWIEALLDQFFDSGGLAAVYQAERPPSLKPLIDELFAAPGLPVVRHVAALEPPDTGEFERDRLRIAGALDRDDLSGGFIFDQEARDDLEQLHGAIEYLRYLEGEKHLVYLTERGMKLRKDTAERLATMASDARVTISPIHTAGLDLSWTGDVRPSLLDITPYRPGTGELRGPSWEQMWANADLRAIARHTGGEVSIYKYASQAFDRLERGNRSQYVLGYYPVDTRWDGGNRRITVTTRRPGVTVLHRRSYYAREDLVPYDRRQFLTSSRIAAGGAYRHPVTDLGVTVAASRVERPQTPWQVHATVVVSPKTIRFVEMDGRQTVSIDIAIFLGNGVQRLVGEVKKRIDIKLEPENYARVMRDGVSFSATVDATARVRYVKAVVYDYAADRLGTAVTQVK